MNEIFEECFPEISEKENEEAENSKENKEESDTEIIEAENSKESEEKSDLEKIKADLNINDVNHVGSLYYQNNALFLILKISKTI